MLPDLRVLKQFLAVASTLSFRRAAEQLHMSQPPLSVAIRQLEESLGLQLFVRSTTGVALTPAGEALRREASRLMNQARLMVNNTQATARGDSGDVRVAFISSAMIGFLPDVLASFRRSYPDIRLKLVEAVSVDVAELVASGEADIGLLSLPTRLAEQLEHQQVLTDRLVLVLPAHHALAGKKALSIAALAQESFVTFSIDRVPSFYQRIVGLCLEQGFQPRIVQEAAHVYTILSLVAGGLGVALLPSAVAQIGHRGVVQIPVIGNSRLLTTSMDIVYRSADLTPAAARFKEAVLNRLVTASER